MGHYTTNAAVAYDMGSMPYVGAPAGNPTAPATGARPRFDVYTGQGREANQAVSPAFMHVLKLFCVLAAIFFVVGVARVTIASATASALNASAAATASIQTAKDTGADLEVMRSVYGADTRIRDLATSTLGMVEPEETVTLDLSASADSAAGASDAAEAAGATANAQ